MKASFPRILAQARTLDTDLRDWCRAECAKEEGDIRRRSRHGPYRRPTPLGPSIALRFADRPSRVVDNSLFTLTRNVARLLAYALSA